MLGVLIMFSLVEKCYLLIGSESEEMHGMLMIYYEAPTPTELHYIFF